MPTTTARGLVVPNLVGDGSDLHDMFQDLADSIEAMMNSAVVLGSTLTASFLISDSATSAGVSMRDSGAAAGVKRSYLLNDDGHTYLRHPNDADAAVVNIGLDYNHLTGVVDFPQGLTGDRVDSPYFRAYRSSAASYASGATVVFNSETDPNGWYDNATGIFLPTVAGMYRLSWAQTLGAALTADEWLSTMLSFAGVQTVQGSVSMQRGGSKGLTSVGSALLAFNGTTDSALVLMQSNHAGAVALDVSAQFNHFEAERVGA